ncbi:hypothetical protein [Guptibacillus algicola]|uniref:hypothetical protein n=1 Tax=Guptibacillus algicola TaxID=225844 RepID=UPI001CD745E7|nr:hypothetical protein [Alkalihalobacillus algicola]MCA0987576.1 hypothetical protein [Alkalihalobacillus algicola]
MNVVKSKREIRELLSNFKRIADYDATGKKYYIVFDDYEREGQWTLMKYDDGSYTIHGKGNTYCDKEEKVVSTEALQKLLWENRKAVNKVIREVNEKALTV